MQTISVRELQRNMRKIADRVKRGESFAVFRNSTMIFQINPVSKDFFEKNDISGMKNVTTLHDVFKELQFDGDKKLSKKIDDITYHN